MPTRKNLFQDSLKWISACIEHLHDTDLPLPEQRARETLIQFCDLLVKRSINPDYGKDVQP
jgi:hypothetical protein